MPKPYTNNFNKNNVNFVNNYQNNNFNKKMSSLRKYCPSAYKFILFNFRNFKPFNHPDGKYQLDLPTSKEFKLVYGQITLKYEISDKKLVLLDLEPSEFLIEGYKKELKQYRNMFFSNEKDKFKIELMFNLKGVFK